MTDPEPTPGVDDDAIRSVVARLARPHPSGGRVVERAAIVAAGAGSEAIMAWILRHGGEPEHAAAPSPRGGLHGSHLGGGGAAVTRPCARFVVPASALD